MGEREDRRLVAVRQAFEGDLHGRAMLIFRKPTASNWSAVTGGTLPLEDIAALEHEALAETAM